MKTDDVAGTLPAAPHEIARRDAQALADETRRVAFLIAIADRNIEGDEFYRYAVDEELLPDEFTVFMHGASGRIIVEQLTPTPGLNERYCASCGQLVHSSTLGGRSYDAVLYRSDDGLHWHSSKWTEHTAENCLAWASFFVQQRRPAHLIYQGAI